MADVTAGLSLRDRRQALLDQATLRGAAFCRSYAAEVDEWLSGLARSVTGDDDRHLALVAVGGYGRAQLCPFSDLDVVLVHKGRRNVARIADAIWYPVWDQGVRLDHSVRRPEEVLEAAAGDLRVALGLLDGRVVWGDRSVAEPLLERARAAWRSKLGSRWLPALYDQTVERHRAQGELAFLLEPELKESHGGLRDAGVITAVAACFPQLSHFVDLAPLQPATDLLTTVRVELHRAAGRALDRLLLQEQDQIAATLGFSDADALMAAVSHAGRSIAWVVDDAWRRRDYWEQHHQRRAQRFGRLIGVRKARAGAQPDGDAQETQEAEPGVVIEHAEVGLAPGAPVSDDPSLPLRVCAVAAERGLPVARSALDEMAERTPPPSDPWPPAVRDALVRLLLTGHSSIEGLEALEQKGLLTRLLPEWNTVRNRPQRNAYHRFTVDRHLFEAAANAAGLAGQVDRPDLLVVGALLHDIGKGMSGDHTAAGIDLVGPLGRRMGFGDADVATLQTLVRHHLLLPDAATRRDLDDPDTIQAVARAVGDRETLGLLGALTEADSVATGPSAWGTWKAGLVYELVDRTGRFLEGEPPPAPGGWVTDLHRRMMADVRAGGRPAVVIDPPNVVVAAPDRRGLLASVAGTLALHGLDVRSADVTSESGVATENFTVDVPRGRWPDVARLRGDLDEVLSGRLVLTDRLAAKAQAYAGGRRPSMARPVVPEVRVEIDASSSSTVVELRAADEIGLLHLVTQALFDCDLDVVSARVATLGSEVIDAFYVRDASGRKVTDERSLDRVRRAMAEALEGGA